MFMVHICRLIIFLELFKLEERTGCGETFLGCRFIMARKYVASNNNCYSLCNKHFLMGETVQKSVCSKDLKFNELKFLLIHLLPTGWNSFLEFSNIDQCQWQFITCWFFLLQEFGFVPQTFVLPYDFKLLKRAWDDGGNRQKWILKPVNGLYMQMNSQAIDKQSYNLVVLVFTI